MADRMTYPIAGSLTRGVTILSGRWAIGAVGAVGAKSCGEGMTLTRTSPGSYTITLSDVYYDLCAAHITVNPSTPATEGFAVKGGTWTRSAKTYTFTLYDLDTPAVTEMSNGELHVTLILKNAS